MLWLDAWAAIHNVTPAALLDLRMRMGAVPIPDAPSQGGQPGSESRQQALILEASGHAGVWLTRNNVGALIDQRGVPVRYGLANETAARNKVVKSADLIGIRPVLVGPHHVGKVIGQFVSIECKHEGWTFKGDKHETAQQNWAQFVVSKGGAATFATGPEIFKQQW